MKIPILTQLISRVFNVRDHGTLHWSFAILFIASVAISSFFQCLQLMCLKKDHIEHRTYLARTLYVKLLFGISAVVVAIAFAITYVVCDGGAGGT